MELRSELAVLAFHQLSALADDPSIGFTDEILRIFIRSLETFTGHGITDQALVEAIRAHNENRRAMEGFTNCAKKTHRASPA